MRIRGARIDQKCIFGNRVRLDFPQGVSIGKRVILEADVWLKLVSVDARLSMGNHTFVGRGTEFDIGKRLSIGAHVMIGPNVFITDHNHRIRRGEFIDQQGCDEAAVVIEDGVWLGTKVVVLPGVTIGAGAVVGAGAIVTRNIPSNAVCVGSPARVIGTRPE